MTRGLANVSRQQEASKAGITAEEVRQIVRGEVVGALRDSSPRQHSTPKPDFKMATMRQNIQVEANSVFVVSVLTFDCLRLTFKLDG